MKKNLTELVFILDRSGSMSGLESDTVGGFNAMIEKQKRQEGDCFVSTVLFDSESDVLHDRIVLARVPKMTEADFTVGGCTALIDALGDSIKHIANIHKYARKEDIPDHTVFVITTDGQENASRRYGSEKVKRMIKKQTENHGWEFLFLGANIDAVETAARYGISADRAANYRSDSRGTHVNYEAIGDVISSVRACKGIAHSWKNKINEDFESRA